MLDSPPGIHPVFHVILVRRVCEDPLRSQHVPPHNPPAIAPANADDDNLEDEYLVEKIVGHRSNPFMVRVKWVGYHNSTWEPREHLRTPPLWRNTRRSIDALGRRRDADAPEERGGLL